jgi:hypothetical protein
MLEESSTWSYIGSCLDGQGVSGLGEDFLDSDVTDYNVTDVLNSDTDTSEDLRICYVSITSV